MNIKEISETLRATVSVKKELAELVQDLIRRDEATEEFILKRIEVPSLLENKSLSLPQKCQELRWRLRKLRYPLLAEAEERFLAAKKKLSLPESIHINPSQFFEKKEIKLELKARSPKEFKELIKKLNSIAEKNGIEDLFI